MIILDISEQSIEQMFSLIDEMNSVKPRAEPTETRQFLKVPTNGKREISNTAIIPIIGSLIDRSHFLEKSGICTSYETLSNTIDKAVDMGVKHVVLDINSGGGYAVGVDGLADKIKETRLNGVKFTAQVHNFACSAAYLIACCCDEIFAPASAIVGSIGTICCMLDDSKAFEKAGLRTVVIASGKFKAIGYPGVEITPEMEKKLQDKLQPHFDYFKSIVSEGRGLTDEALNSIATGEYWTGSQALKLGLIDGISNFQSTLKKVKEGKKDMDENKKEVNASPLPATVAEIEQMFPSASAEFKWNCVKSAMTKEQVKDAYIGSIEAENALLKDKIKSLEEQAKAEPVNATPEANVRIPGNHVGVAVQGVVDLPVGSPISIADEKAHKLANELNIPLWQAYSMVFTNDPELEEKCNGGGDE